MYCIGYEVILAWIADSSYGPVCSPYKEAHAWAFSALSEAAIERGPFLANFRAYDRAILGCIVS